MPSRPRTARWALTNRVSLVSWRASMVDSVRPFSPQVVTVFGVSGFLGPYVFQALERRNYRIRVAVRRPNLAGNVMPFGRVGQILAVQANLRFPSSVQAAVQ